MRTLITGGSGFIARYFIERLRADGQELTLIDSVPWVPPDGVRFVRGDVRDAAAVRRAATGASRVLHLAAAHHDAGIAHDTYFGVNEEGARVLADAMTAEGIRDLCFFSSAAVYGAAPAPRHETTIPEPESPYGASKLAAERVFAAWTSGDAARRTLVLRPTVVFGPRNFANMYSLIRQIDRHLFLTVGSGRNVKSLAYVENLVDAALVLWSGPSRAAFDVYNFAEKPDLTSRQITETIFHALGRRPPRLALPMTLALAAGLPFDLVSALTGRDLPISRARIRKFAGAETRFEADKLAATGFRPAVSLRDGLERTVRWYLAEGRDQPSVRHIPAADVTPFDA